MHFIWIWWIQDAVLASPPQSAVSALTSSSRPANNDSLSSVVKLKQSHEVKKCFKVIQQRFWPKTETLLFFLRHLFLSSFFLLLLFSFPSNRCVSLKTKCYFRRKSGSILLGNRNVGKCFDLSFSFLILTLYFCPRWNSSHAASELSSSANHFPQTAYFGELDIFTRNTGFISSLDPGFAQVTYKEKTL